MIKLKQGEKVKMKIRKHWFVLFERVVILVFIFIAPFILYVFVAGKVTSIGANQTIFLSLTPSLFVFLIATWSLLIWMKLASIWTDYYLDMWIVTNRRIVDIEQKGFFNREVSTLPIERIQDVTIEVKGVVATVLNFGNIHVQTAGESREFSIRGIPDPRNTKEIILKQHELTSNEEG